jgi:hypothetical protein
MELCSEATAWLGNWTSMEGSIASQLFESVFKRLKDSVQARYTSFYHICLLSPVLNKSLLNARRVANETVSNVSSAEQERTAACNALNNEERFGDGCNHSFVLLRPVLQLQCLQARSMGYYENYWPVASAERRSQTPGQPTSGWPSSRNGSRVGHSPRCPESLL